MASQIDTTGAQTLFDILPQIVKDQITTLLGEASVAILADERAASAPARTGALQAALTVRDLVGELRARIGLMGPGTKRAWYGRVINFGRKAQVVIVQRRRIGTAKTLRHRRKRIEDIGSTYALRVTALPARDFIDFSRPAVDAEITTALNALWPRVINKVGHND